MTPLTPEPPGTPQAGTGGPSDATGSAPGTPDWRQHQGETRWERREARRKARREWREQWRAQHGNTPHLAMGIFLTLLGVVLTFDRLQLIDAGLALRWWPIGFVILGATLLSRRQDSQGRFWGGFWIVIGVWLLLNSLEIVRIGFWELFWPLVLVLIGVRLIMRGPGASMGKGAWAHVSGASEPGSAQGAATTIAGRPNLMAVLCESKGRVTQAISRASMTSILGGCNLDLREATATGGEPVVVDVFGVMGGHEIGVPSGWTIEPNVVSIMAGVSDKRPPSAVPRQGDAPRGRLVIRGMLFMSGLTINT